MGLIVNNFTTEQGFLVPELYIQVNCIRMLKTSSGSTYGMTYSCLAYKSVTDFEAGVSPLPIPMYLANVEDYLEANDFYKQTLFGFAYEAIKKAWEQAGYIVTDYYPHPPTPKTYTYDCSGYNFEGFNCAGFDKEGYSRTGFNAEGYNRQGYDIDGYNKEGYDIDGFNRVGFNAEGLDRSGNVFSNLAPSTMEAPAL